MATDMPRAVGRKLVRFHERFANDFGRREAIDHSLIYLKGLIMGDGPKNVERIAMQFAPGRNGNGAGQNEVLALQGFITHSPWDSIAIQRKIQSTFVEELGPSTSQWSIGTVGVIDESGFEKRGTESCGVKHQYCGRLGKEENCQVGVFLIGVTPGGSALLEHQLYLPKEWAKDKERRKKTRVPEHIAFDTKPEISIQLLDRTIEAGHVHFDWITADIAYGHDGAFLDALEARNQRYLVEIPLSKTVWLLDPATQVPAWSGRGHHPTIPSRDAVLSVEAVRDLLPTDAWHQFQLREGTKGPLVFDFAFVRVWSVRHRKPGPVSWLIIRRSLDKNPEIKYFISNADEGTPLGQMALVTGSRWRVEEFFEDGKGDFGMADYEARAWTSWHHHMSLVSMAHLFITANRYELKQDIPELTLPMALRLIQAALVKPQLTEDDAIRLTEYHLARNRTARNSHRKSWLRKHKYAKPKRLL